MTDRPEPWRPTLPPKAKTTTAITTVSKPSDAIRGAAAHAFNSRPTISSTQIAKPVSNGARLAAAAAGNTRVPSSLPLPGQDAAKASSAAYARGRLPAGIERTSSKDVLLSANLLSPLGQSPVRRTARSPSHIAARMASSSNSPVRSPPGSAQGDSPTSKDQAALLAGKLASMKSYQDGKAPPSHSPMSSPSTDQHSLDLKQIPFLPRKTTSPPKQEAPPSVGASTAAAQAAARHAAPAFVPPVPAYLQKSRTGPERWPVRSTTASPEFISPTESELGPLLELTSTSSSLASPSERTVDGAGDGAQPAAPISIKGTTHPRNSIETVTSSNTAQPAEYRTGLTKHSFADAIAASSIASSRAPSPTKADLLPKVVLRSRSHSHSLLPHYHHREKLADPPLPRTPAPSRTLKQTLRKHRRSDDKDEEEDTKRGRRHFVRKHPHKHHEGDRKRWRDKVTDRERRRYEGVWAANRGLFMFWDSPDAAFGDTWKRAAEADLVVNVVVRDIWERSHLPKDALEEVWDLVAPEGAKDLQRDQFVVGLWLIDQRLKGRKLPVRVSPSVWASVRHPPGVKISRKPY